VTSAVLISPNSQSDPQPKSRWLDQKWLEPRFVVLTLAFLLTSIAGESLGWSRELVLVLDIASYVFGGIFGAKGALEALRERRIDVDMLMILAALYADDSGGARCCRC